MRKLTAAGIVFSQLSMSCVAADDENVHGGENIERTKEPIVRGTVEAARRQVVAVYGEGFDGSTVQCTGVYVAPRVVLTAAHCLSDALFANRLFVYHGSNFHTDLPMLQDPPPPSDTASPWANVENWQSHPDYGTDDIFPDVAMLFLDRRLPFDPLPISRTNLGSAWVNKPATLVGWGGSKALTADITQVEGAGVKRTGTTILLGSPTAADYDPNDPHPGLLIPSVRAGLLKTDGRTPRSNTCAGDSGSPLIIREYGQDYVAGINSWTGLWCENYSLFTRMQPILPWYDANFSKAGQLPVKLQLNCVSENENGSLRAHFGYDNQNLVSLYAPLGTSNVLAQDTDSLRPTRFYPGAHDFAISVDFARTATVVYKVTPQLAPTTEVRASSSSPRCGADRAMPVLASRACEAALSATCIATVPNTPSYKYAQFEECVDFNAELAWVPPPCADEYLAVLECNADSSPSQFACYEYYLTPESIVCDAQQGALNACFDEVLGGG